VALTLPGDARAARPFVLGIAGFAATMRNQLRALPGSQGCAGLLPEDLFQRLDAARSAPALVLLWLAQWMQAHRRDHPCDNAAARQIDESLNALSMAHGSCERIANTPLPFSYSVILHRSAYLYCTLLPFGLVSSTGWWTPLVATFVSYTFFALEAVSDEIEEPFGLSTNDLALNAMVVGIEASLREMLGETPPPALQPDRNCVLT
jgi:putative membrane protein